MRIWAAPILAVVPFEIRLRIVRHVELPAADGHAPQVERTVAPTDELSAVPSPLSVAEAHEDVDGDAGEVLQLDQPVLGRAHRQTVRVGRDDPPQILERR